MTDPTSLANVTRVLQRFDAMPLSEFKRGVVVMTTIGSPPKCHCGALAVGDLRVGGSMLQPYCQAHFDIAWKAGQRR